MYTLCTVIYIVASTSWVQNRKLPVKKFLHIKIIYHILSVYAISLHFELNRFYILSSLNSGAFASEFEKNISCLYNKLEFISSWFACDFDTEDKYIYVLSLC